MRLSDDLLSNEPVLEALAGSAGLATGDVKAVVAGVLGELAAAAERNTLSRGGLADLVAFMGRGAPQRLLDEPEWIADPARSNRVQDYGIAALDLLLGSKDRSRAIADRVSRQTGVDAAVVRDLMPAVAAVAMGGMRRETASAFGDIFGQRTNPTGDGPRGASGGYGEASVPRSGGDIPDQAPLPLPGELPRGGYEGGGYESGREMGGGRGAGYPRGQMPRGERAPQGGGSERTPYDDLSDILRRGGFGGGGQQGGAGGGGQTINLPGGGGVLANIVREVIGAVLGFQSRGIVGWIIRAVVLRYGWQIVQTIIRRVLLGGR